MFPRIVQSRFSIRTKPRAAHHVHSISRTHSRLLNDKLLNTKIQLCIYIVKPALGFDLVNENHPCSESLFKPPKPSRAC